MKKLNICKIGDQFGWAYFFVAQEQKKYSEHNIMYQKHDQVNLKDADLVYLHSPDISDFIKDELPLKAKAQKIKVIGSYAGQVDLNYSYADLIVSVSYPHINKIKKYYPETPVVFLPESVDTSFFLPKKFNKNSFKVGWAGRLRKVKRPHILEKLEENVIKQCEWGKKYFVDNRTLHNMVQFYHSIDVFILVSQSECMPRVILEAMACGLPVISTNVGCIRMLLDEFCLIDNELSDMEIVEKMNEKLKLLKIYPRLREEIGKRNRNHISKYFSWRNNQSLWDTVFNAVYENDFATINRVTNGFIKPFYDLYPIENVISIENDNLNNSDIIKPQMPEDNKSKLIYLAKDSLIEFWLLEESCRDCIKYKGKKLDSNFIKFGVANVEDKIKLSDYFGINFINKNNITINIIVDKKRETKEVTLYNTLIKVPMPVVNYLENLNMWKKEWT